MTIALCATALVILALLSEITWPMLERKLDLLVTARTD